MTTQTLILAVSPLNIHQELFIGLYMSNVSNIGRVIYWMRFHSGMAYSLIVGEENETVTYTHVYLHVCKHVCLYNSDYCEQNEQDTVGREELERNALCSAGGKGFLTDLPCSYPEEKDRRHLKDTPLTWRGTLKLVWPRQCPGTEYPCGPGDIVQVKSNGVLSSSVTNVEIPIFPSCCMGNLVSLRTLLWERAARHW